MSDQNHGGIYPHYYGRINRVDIGLDVIYQEYTRAGSNTTSGSIVTSKAKRPWTRVFAKIVKQKVPENKSKSSSWLGLNGRVVH